MDWRGGRAIATFVYSFQGLATLVYRLQGIVYSFRGSLTLATLGYCLRAIASREVMADRK